MSKRKATAVRRVLPASQRTGSLSCDDDDDAITPADDVQQEANKKARNQASRPPPTERKNDPLSTVVQVHNPPDSNNKDDNQNYISLEKKNSPATATQPKKGKDEKKSGSTKVSLNAILARLNPTQNSTSTIQTLTSSKSSIQNGEHKSLESDESTVSGSVMVPVMTKSSTTSTMAVKSGSQKATKAKPKSATPKNQLKKVPEPSPTANEHLLSILNRVLPPSLQNGTSENVSSKKRATQPKGKGKSKNTATPIVENIATQADNLAKVPTAWAVGSPVTTGLLQAKTSTPQNSAQLPVNLSGAPIPLNMMLSPVDNTTQKARNIQTPPIVIQPTEEAKKGKRRSRAGAVGLPVTAGLLQAKTSTPQNSAQLPVNLSGAPIPLNMMLSPVVNTTQKARNIQTPPIVIQPTEEAKKGKRRSRAGAVGLPVTAGLLQAKTSTPQNSAQLPVNLSGAPIPLNMMLSPVDNTTQKARNIHTPDPIVIQPTEEAKTGKKRSRAKKGEPLKPSTKIALKAKISKNSDDVDGGKGSKPSTPGTPFLPPAPSVSYNSAPLDNPSILGTCVIIKKEPADPDECRKNADDSSDEVLPLDLSIARDTAETQDYGDKGNKRAKKSPAQNKATKGSKRKAKSDETESEDSNNKKKKGTGPDKQVETFNHDGSKKRNAKQCTTEQLPVPQPHAKKTARKSIRDPSPVKPSKNNEETENTETENVKTSTTSCAENGKTSPVGLQDKEKKNGKENKPEENKEANKETENQKTGHNEEPNKEKEDKGAQKQMGEQLSLDGLKDGDLIMSTQGIGGPNTSISVKQENDELVIRINKNASGNILNQKMDLSMSPTSSIRIAKVVDRAVRAAACKARLASVVAQLDDEEMDENSTLAQNQLNRSSAAKADKPKECPICGKVFNRGGNLAGHMRKHTGERPYVCDICNKGFTFLTNLRAHMNVHTGERPYKCKLCDKAYTQLCGLQRHMASHSDAKPFTCQTCNKAFKHLHVLRRHELVHSEYRPYRCLTCGKGFLHAWHLEKHVRVHTGEKAFKCVDCDAGFTSKQAFTAHVNKEHLGLPEDAAAAICQDEDSQMMEDEDEDEEMMDDTANDTANETANMTFMDEPTIDERDEATLLEKIQNDGDVNKTGMDEPSIDEREEATLLKKILNDGADAVANIEQEKEGEREKEKEYDNDRENEDIGRAKKSGNVVVEKNDIAKGEDSRKGEKRQVREVIIGMKDIENMEKETTSNKDVEKEVSQNESGNNVENNNNMKGSHHDQRRGEKNEEESNNNSKEKEKNEPKVITETIIKLEIDDLSYYNNL